MLILQILKYVVDTITTVILRVSNKMKKGLA